jgi:galactonate dehydratase
MKITKVGPLVLGTGWRDLIFVKVETDEGLTGVGEARVLNRTKAVGAVQAGLVRGAGAAGGHRCTREREA